MADTSTVTVTVTDESFAEQVLGSDKPVLVDFWATWCGPCKQVAPILEEIASAHPEKITVAKVDIEKNTQNAQKYGVRAVPTMILFSRGEPVRTIVGTKSKAALLKELDGYLD